MTFYLKEADSVIKYVANLSQGNSAVQPLPIPCLSKIRGDPPQRQFLRCDQENENGRLPQKDLPLLPHPVRSEAALLLEKLSVRHWQGLPPTPGVLPDPDFFNDRFRNPVCLHGGDSDCV